MNLTLDDWTNYALGESPKEKGKIIDTILMKDKNARIFLDGIKISLEENDYHKGKMYKKLKLDPNKIIHF